MNIFNELPQKDIEFLHNYLVNYSDGGETGTLPCDKMEYWLRYWSENKEHLYKMFGNQFTLKREIEFAKCREDIIDELWRKFRKYDTPTEKAISRFRNNLENYILDTIDYYSHYELRSRLLDLCCSYDFLAENVYTGASFTMISQDLAKDMGAHIISNPVFVRGGESPGGYGQRAFIENMNLGPVSLKNIIAFVSENPSDDDPLKVDAVLGMDFIKRAGEIQIDLSTMTLTIPVQRTLPLYGRNIILEVNIPIVEASDVNGNKYTFILDTGASEDNLSDLWFSKNAEIAAKLPTLNQRTWGHGGIVQNQIVKIPEYKLIIDNASADFKEIPAILPANGAASSTRDGRLGMGLLRQFKKAIFNFEDMFVAFE